MFSMAIFRIRCFIITDKENIEDDYRYTQSLWNRLECLVEE